MERKLASIQKILDLQPIAGADKIEVATVLGWQLVVKKNEFKVGELAIYCEVDSILPDRPEFAFLQARKFRIKTIRLRGQISQGICFPLSILPEHTLEIVEDLDVTELLGVTKHEIAIPVQLRGQVKGTFPGFLVKTDELRIQSRPSLLDEIRDVPCYLAWKIDGTSATFARFNGEIEICSRNMSLKETEENVYWKMFHKYNLGETLPEGFAVQGEVAGPGIQKNPLGLEEIQLFVFNVFDINRHGYLSLSDTKEFCAKLNLPMVPIQEENVTLNVTLAEILDMAKGTYPLSRKPREGLVIRPMQERYSLALGGRLSFKVINNDFLLQEE